MAPGLLSCVKLAMEQAVDVTITRTANHVAQRVANPKAAPKCKAPAAAVAAGRYGLRFELPSENKPSLDSCSSSDQWCISKLFRKLIHFIVHDFLELN